MIGIDVGSTAVTLSNGTGVERRPHEVPAELVCRVGDDVPCVLLRQDGFDLRQAHEVYADVVAGAVRAHRATVGPAESAPAAVAVPGWWTPRALGWVGGALEAAGLGDVILVNDGEAAVLGHLAAGGSLPATVAVVDLGAEASSVVIVERCTERPAAVPSPALVHVEGGDRLDGAVLHHLVGGLADLGVGVDAADPETVLAARGALGQCRDVREALSMSAVESVHPMLPGADRRLRLVRSELEELADAWAEAVIRMVDTALDQYPSRVEAVLLVGGLAAMPLISQRLSADLGLEVLVAGEPTQVVARGAATRAVVPVQEPPKRTWRRKATSPDRATRPAAIERAEQPALPALPTSRRRERGRRRKVEETARLANPAIAALPAGTGATPEVEAQDQTPETPQGPMHAAPSVQETWPDAVGSPADLPRGSHMASMVVPVDELDESAANDPATAVAGR